MINGIGIDLVDQNRISILVHRNIHRLVRIAFSDEEKEIIDGVAIRDKIPYIAGRLAAKEAVLKVLGIGFWPFSLHEIMVARTRGGQPEIKLSGNLLQFEKEKNISSWFVTITHEGSYAIAVVIAEKLCNNCSGIS